MTEFNNDAAKKIVRIKAENKAQRTRNESEYTCRFDWRERVNRREMDARKIHATYDGRNRKNLLDFQLNAGRIPLLQAAKRLSSGRNARHRLSKTIAFHN